MPMSALLVAEAGGSQIKAQLGQLINLRRPGLKIKTTKERGYSSVAGLWVPLKISSKKRVNIQTSRLLIYFCFIRHHKAGGEPKKGAPPSKDGSRGRVSPNKGDSGDDYHLVQVKQLDEEEKILRGGLVPDGIEVGVHLNLLVHPLEEFLKLMSHLRGHAPVIKRITILSAAHQICS